MTSPLVAKLDGVLQVVAASLVVVLLATVTAGIVSRGVNHPLSFTDELSGLLMVWLACFGWMIATRRGAHIRIRFFHDLLPMSAHRVVEAAILVSCILLGGIVAWHSVHLMRTNSDVEMTTLPVMSAWLYVPLFPAGVLTVGQAIADLFGLNRQAAAPPDGVA